MYRPGDIIPVSAVYQVHHDKHRPAHEVNCVAGDVFPGCRTCGDAVRFVQLTPTDFMARQMISEDPDFAIRASASGEL